jgi:hypothetical protein
MFNLLICLKFLLLEKNGPFSLEGVFDLFGTKHIEGNLEPSTKYEIRAFLVGREFLEYLNSDLIKKSLVKLYGLAKYNNMINWFKPRVEHYNWMVSR